MKPHTMLTRLDRGGTNRYYLVVDTETKDVFLTNPGNAPLSLSYVTDDARLLMYRLLCTETAEEARDVANGYAGTGWEVVT